MSNVNLAPLELVELRELLNTEVVCFKKIHANMAMVQDEELETFMKRSLDTKKKAITSLRDFINSAINVNQSNNNNNKENNENSSSNSSASTTSE